MAIQDLTIDGSQANLTSTALRSRLAKLTLTRVRVLQTAPQAKLVRRSTPTPRARSS